MSDLELHGESLTCGIHRDSNPSHQPTLPSQESGNGPTIVTKPGNGPSSLTKSELNCHRTKTRSGPAFAGGEVLRDKDGKPYRTCCSPGRRSRRSRRY
jgi:hypothetical protein